MTTKIDDKRIRNHQPTPTCLQDKVILVTGAGSGIGKTIALTYAKCGAKVLLLGRTQAKLQAVYDEIERLGLPTPVILPMDLKTADSSQMQTMAVSIQKQVGRLDGLLHNAGVLGTLTPLETYDPVMFDEVIRVNMTAVFMLTQALLPLLRESKAGSVIFTTSTVGHDLRACWGAYALSKQGVEGMTKIWTQETHDHTRLRFNAINPGAIRSNMRADAYPNEDPMTLAVPEDIVSSYVYLMTDKALNIKGCMIDCQPN